MSSEKLQTVIAYHDETKEAGKGKLKGHILLFVPAKLTHKKSTPLFGDETIEHIPLTAIYEKILTIRSDYQLNTKLHFSEISGQRWGMFDCGTRLIVEAGVEALKHKRSSTYSTPTCCKFAVMFYPKPNKPGIYGGSERKETVLRHDETMMRILLKGALHSLYGASNQVVLRGIVSDGQPHHRRLNLDRTIRKMFFDGFEGKSSIRDYVGFSDKLAIKQIPSDHRLHEIGSHDYVHANMLQLADLLLGAVTRCCFAETTVCKSVPRLGSTAFKKKDVVSYPVREMLEKARRGSGFQHSGHYRAFSVSQVSFHNRRISFASVTPPQRLIDDGSFSLFTA